MGWGKTRIYYAYALTKPEMLTLFVTPLNSINIGHKRTFAEHGIKTADLNKQDDVTEDTRCILTSPESIKTHFPILRKFSTWKDLLLVIDECHIVTQWGESFRTAFQDLDELLLAFERRPQILALSATLSVNGYKALTEKLGIKNPFRFTAPPVKENMSLTTIDTSLGIPHLKSIIKNLSKTDDRAMIFCRTTTDVLNVFNLVESIVGFDETNVMCTSVNTVAERERVVNDLTCDTGKLKLIVTTSLLQMGVDATRVRYSMFHKMPDTLESLLQGSGRAGRSGEQCYMIVFTKLSPGQGCYYAENFRTNTSECSRLQLNSHFEGGCAKYRGSDFCCTNCGNNWNICLLSNDPLIEGLLNIVNPRPLDQQSLIEPDSSESEISDDESSEVQKQSRKSEPVETTHSRTTRRLQIKFHTPDENDIYVTESKPKRRCRSAPSAAKPPTTKKINSKTIKKKRKKPRNIELVLKSEDNFKNDLYCLRSEYISEFHGGNPMAYTVLTSNMIGKLSKTDTLKKLFRVEDIEKVIGCSDPIIPYILGVLRDNFNDV